MDAEELVGADRQSQPSPKRNRGSFQPGDPRINRRGRPKGAEAAARRAKAGKRPTGRVKTLFVPDLHLRARLSNPRGPWLTNLPKGFRVVDCQVDVARGGLVLTLHSAVFPEVKVGQPVPEIEPVYNGLKWVRPSFMNFWG